MEAASRIYTEEVIDFFGPDAVINASTGAVTCEKRATIPTTEVMRAREETR